jgi:Na+-transporting methylmalonyl-CoA/oxaloacetate decarboxylase gamma subunit
VEDAINVFINGIAGVFAGMFVLYLSIRLMSAIADRLQRTPGTGEH